MVIKLFFEGIFGHGIDLVETISRREYMGNWVPEFTGSTPLISGAAFCVRFQVEAPVTRRSPHRPVREDFPHTVPRLRSFLPDHRPDRRHPVRRITLLPCLRNHLVFRLYGLCPLSDSHSSYQTNVIPCFTFPTVGR